MIIKASNFFRFTVLTCLFFSIIIPSTHVFSYSINLFGLLFDAFDLVFALLIILSVVSLLLYIDFRLLKDRKIILIVSLFLLVNFIYLIFGLIKYGDLNQSLYDFRVIAYYLIILLPKILRKSLKPAISHLPPGIYLEPITNGNLSNS